MSIKERAIALVQAMPDTITWAEALERIRMMAAIEQAEAGIAAGQGIPQEEAEARIKAWLQKLSRRRVA
jgi:hypothetical protein